MYKTAIFERAMNACSYQLDHIFYNKGLVREVHGLVPIAKRKSIDGVNKTIIEWKSYRWNDAGQCFSRYSSKRKREYDLPLRTIEEFSKQKNP